MVALQSIERSAPWSFVLKYVEVCLELLNIEFYMPHSSEFSVVRRVFRSFKNCFFSIELCAPKKIPVKVYV